uniref:Uncharacterized protein n=1 Tax=Noctiluca scintillans TaxID=2966 RepID=A0A7S1A237_NOCSC
MAQVVFSSRGDETRRRELTQMETCALRDDEGSKFDADGWEICPDAEGCILFATLEQLMMEAAFLLTQIEAAEAHEMDCENRVESMVQRIIDIRLGAPGETDEAVLEQMRDDIIATTCHIRLWHELIEGHLTSSQRANAHYAEWLSTVQQANRQTREVIRCMELELLADTSVSSTSEPALVLSNLRVAPPRPRSCNRSGQPINVMPALRESTNSSCDSSQPEWTPRQQLELSDAPDMEVERETFDSDAEDEDVRAVKLDVGLRSTPGGTNSQPETGVSSDFSSVPEENRRLQVVLQGDLGTTLPPAYRHVLATAQDISEVSTSPSREGSTETPESDSVKSGIEVDSVEMEVEGVFFDQTGDGEMCSVNSVCTNKVVSEETSTTTPVTSSEKEWCGADFVGASSGDEAAPVCNDVLKTLREPLDVRPTPRFTNVPAPDTSDASRSLVREVSTVSPEFESRELTCNAEVSVQADISCQAAEMSPECGGELEDSCASENGRDKAVPATTKLTVDESAHDGHCVPDAATCEPVHISTEVIGPRTSDTGLSEMSEKNQRSVPDNPLMVVAAPKAELAKTSSREDADRSNVEFSRTTSVSDVQEITGDTVLIENLSEQRSRDLEETQGDEMLDNAKTDHAELAEKVSILPVPPSFSRGSRGFGPSARCRSWPDPAVYSTGEGAPAVWTWLQTIANRISGRCYDGGSVGCVDRCPAIDGDAVDFEAGLQRYPHSADVNRFPSHYSSTVREDSTDMDIHEDGEGWTSRFPARRLVRERSALWERGDDGDGLVHAPHFTRRKPSESFSSS